MKWVDETIEGDIFDAKQFGGNCGTSITDVLVENGSIIVYGD